MKKNYWWFMVVIVFVAGLMISNMLVQAKENTPVIKWEYKTVSINYISTKDVSKDATGRKRILLHFRKDTDTRRISSKDLSILNEHGKDGWELCGVNNVNYYFKRKIRKDQQINRLSVTAKLGI
jgi:hypothetical protein